MLHVPHLVEEQFTVAHRAIGKGTGIRNPCFRHSNRQCIQFLAAVFEVAEQFVLSVGALGQDDLWLEFGETEGWRWTELGFAFR